MFFLLYTNYINPVIYECEVLEYREDGWVVIRWAGHERSLVNEVFSTLEEAQEVKQSRMMALRTHFPEVLAEFRT